MKLQVEQAKEHIGKKFPYSYTIPSSELGDVTAFPWSRHDITINGEFWFDGQNYIVQGSIESKGDYDCSRCLNTTEHNRKDSIERSHIIRSISTFTKDFLEGIVTLMFRSR